MEIYLLNEDFEIIYVIDSYESFIWTDRFNKCGDFELYTTVDVELLTRIKPNRFLLSSHSNHLMVIEKISYEYDSEEGSHMTISGRSLESILDRRVVSKQTTIDDTFQNGIQKLLNENMIQPSDDKRRIDLIFSPSEDPYITNIKLEAQYHGEDLYSIVTELCEKHKIGFYIYLNEENTFEMSFYKGIDRSYRQTDNPYVVFSPSFDNLFNSNYELNTEEYKNVAYVSGEGEGSNKKVKVVDPDSAQGLDRREIFVDAGSISKTDSETQITDAQYETLLEQKGNEELVEYKKINSVNGECDTVEPFSYGVDFYLGDIVSIRSEYGVEDEARITEIIRSVSSSEVSTYPTLESVSDGTEEPIEPNIPSEYTELEYIETTGTQWINTNVKTNSATVIKTTMRIKKIVNASGGAFFFGSTSLYQAPGIELYIWSGQMTYNKGSSGSTATNVFSVDDKIDIVTNSNETSIICADKNLTMNLPNSSGDMVSSIPLCFATLPRTDVAYPGSVQVFNFSMLEDDQMLRNFIPCKNKDGVGGFYDTVTKAFYTNSGTGSFVLGPEK